MEEALYPQWEDHRFAVFLKIGICLKSHEIDFLRNVARSENLSEHDRLETAKLLRILADDFERGWTGKEAELKKWLDKVKAGKPKQSEGAE